MVVLMEDTLSYLRFGIFNFDAILDSNTESNIAGPWPFSVLIAKQPTSILPFGTIVNLSFEILCA